MGRAEEGIIESSGMQKRDVNGGVDIGRIVKIISCKLSTPENGHKLF